MGSAPSTPTKLYRDHHEKGEIIGIQSKLVQNGGVQAADMEFIIHGPAAQFIGRTNGYSTLIPPPAIHMVKP